MIQRLTLLLAALLLFFPANSSANLPNPNLSQVPMVLTATPDGSFGTTLTINGPLGPVSGASVVLQWTPDALDRFCICQAQPTPSISGLTDSSGEVTFFVRGGGCTDPARIGNMWPVTVFANGILMAQMAVNSPDAVDANGNLPTDGGGYGGWVDWDPAGECTVSLADAVFHTLPIANGLVELCSNFTAPFDDNVSLGDAV
ncbi:MAG: hypothetical protein HKN21_05550, partial [Candidatus Eisenbacteria bacterium]|nr:hypothetical protein [Candidatus Eisenbacteria bacterium]